MEMKIMEKEKEEEEIWVMDYLLHARKIK